MKKIALSLVLAALVGCSSTNKQQEPQPQPRIEDAPSKAAPAAQEKPAPKEEPIAITIRKGEKHGPEAAYNGNPPPGYVCFDFKNVDLAQVALPLFSKQAGVIIEYPGKTPRRLTLGFNSPEPWRDALALICRFTSLHVVRSQIAGRLELREGFADPTALLSKFDPNDKTQAGTGEGTLSGGVPGVGPESTTSGGTSSPSNGAATSSQGGGSQTFDASDYQQPKQPGADRIDELRRGVTTTNSGAK